jgi:hypothetical protein
MTIQDTAIEKLRHLPDPLAQIVNNFIDALINQSTKLSQSYSEHKSPVTASELFPQASQSQDAWNNVMSQIADPNSNQHIKVTNLFQQWAADDDIAQQQETLQWLTQALDDDRLSDRPLFP